MCAIRTLSSVLRLSLLITVVPRRSALFFVASRKSIASKLGVVRSLYRITATLALLAVLVSPIGATICQMDCTASHLARRADAAGRHVHSHPSGSARHASHCGQLHKTSCVDASALEVQTASPCADHATMEPRRKAVIASDIRVNPSVTPAEVSGPISGALSESQLLPSSRAPISLAHPAILPLRI